nr:asparagine synthase (glutamine-hydrolyzing) [Candidatus Aminicenantes bacterium]
MSGIAGLLHLDGAEPSPSILERMIRTLVHRGPDGEGIRIAGPVGLGHRRRTAAAGEEAGGQPLSNEDRSVWITADAAIYNDREIRGELRERGHVFRSQADAEIIIHAYEEWGPECLRKFNGVFAFGLWDDRLRRLWLVRDRLGVKPLFYARLPNAFLFGSEIKALLAHPAVKRNVDVPALAYFLGLNYTPAPRTLFREIRQVLPGHYLLAGASGVPEECEYWDLRFQEGGDSRREDDYLEEFEALLADAVRLRLRGDIQPGAFLSGGIDSSALVYWMRRLGRGPLRTFTVGFPERSFDELSYARSTAGRLGTEHIERIIGAEAAAILPEIVRHAEEPTADSSMVAVYFLAQTAGRLVPAVLSGEGADEILAGYETYQAYYARRAYRILPAFLRRGILRLACAAWPVSERKESVESRLRRFAAGAETEGEAAHGAWRMIFTPDERRDLLRPTADPAAGADYLELYRRYFQQAGARHPLNRMLYVDTRFYLPNDMLVKADRMCMAHGLEA